MIMANTVTATFRTSKELKDRIDFLAKETKRSSSYYFNMLLEEHIEELENIYLSEKVLENIKKGKEKTIFAEDLYKELGI